MALSVSFSATQTPGLPGNIIFTDLSTGTDVLVTGRRIYIQGTDGDYVVLEGNTNEYSTWGSFPSVSTITLEDILPTQDIAARVVVEWVDVSGNVMYNSTQYIGFTCYNEDLDYSLTQNVTGNQLLINDNNWFGNKNKLRLLIDSGNKAIERNSDIASAQICYDLATEIRINKAYYFNQNS